MRAVGVCAGLALLALASARALGAQAPVIVSPADATYGERLAALEARCYIYLLTGEMPRIVPSVSGANGADSVVIRRAEPTGSLVIIPTLFKGFEGWPGPEGYRLEARRRGEAREQDVTGGDDAGVLYGTYRLLEHYGVRFHLHDDVVPEGTRPYAELPAVNERGKPLFELRGIQPFHDFPEGPDWWNEDDYKQILTQLPKLGMNFLGLHTYPEGNPGAEPTVWIGPPSELGPNGRALQAYPASWQNTARGDWGYEAKATSSFRLGASQLFDVDAYGADVMRGVSPRPQGPDQCVDLFERSAAMFREAFRLGHSLGVKVCVGTETPLTIPAQVRERLVAAGKDPHSPDVRRELYEGIFRRVRSYPIDYYWFWTPEGWTWSGASQEQVQATMDDLNAAIEARETTRVRFGLATCGWVLGPERDRSLFDKTLPPDIALSCINRQVGHDPVDRGFASVKREGKWAIPWLEDDPALSSPQLWVGRMRQDAVDAHRYGCNGLMGIHWRTRVLAPNIAALAQASWRQAKWGPPEGEGPAADEGPVGGQYAAFPQSHFADTDEQALYQTVRYNTSGYTFRVPNGDYTVVVRLCEPAYDAAGKRVFDIALQGKTMVEAIDIFAKVGKNRALDYRFDGVRVIDGQLQVGFGYRVEYPCVAAIEIIGRDVRRGVNCGGPAYEQYAADWPPSAGGDRRGVSSLDFYQDWAEAEFGREVSQQAAAIFARVDGRLPRPSNWVDGPGGMTPDSRPWSTVEGEYGFVAELEALEPLVRGAGNRERFAYWLETFRYMRAQAKVGCAWGVLAAAIANARAGSGDDAKRDVATEQGVPALRGVVRALEEVYSHLLATVSTQGELGTVANWEQHLLPRILERPRQELAALVGGPLPDGCDLGTAYAGPTRLIVATRRTLLLPDEPLRLKALVLAETAPREVVLLYRAMGTETFRSVALEHVARGVYAVTLPATRVPSQGLEYCIRLTGEKGEPVWFPSTAPRRCQTVVVAPRTPPLEEGSQ